MRFLTKIAGADAETLRLCPPHDWGNVGAVAGIMIFTWLYQATLFFLISHLLFAPAGQTPASEQWQTMR